MPTGYEVDISSVQKEGSKLKARLTSPQNTLELTITGLTEGRIRVQIDELKDIAIRQRLVTNFTVEVYSTRSPAMLGILKSTFFWAEESRIKKSSSALPYTSSSFPITPDFPGQRAVVFENFFFSIITNDLIWAMVSQLLRVMGRLEIDSHYA